MVVRDRMAPGDNLERRLKQDVLMGVLEELVSVSGVQGLILRTISSWRRREPMSERVASLP